MSCGVTKPGYNYHMTSTTGTKITILMMMKMMMMMSTQNNNNNNNNSISALERYSLVPK